MNKIDELIEEINAFPEEIKKFTGLYDLAVTIKNLPESVKIEKCRSTGKIRIDTLLRMLSEQIYMAKKFTVVNGTIYLNGVVTKAGEKRCI